MRNSALLVLVLVITGASACAARTPMRTATPARYSCEGDVELIRNGEKLLASEAAADGPMAAKQLAWRDGAGDHFVTFPSSTADVEVVEYVVPADQHIDAVERTYDASKGIARVDWRMTRQRTCRAEGGYSDAISRFAGGASYTDIKTQLSLQSESEARELIHDALLRATRRYYGH